MTATISNEDLTGDNQEIELVHYYKLRDFGQLLAAAEIVEQEQWELKIPKTEGNLFAGTFRVRKERGRGEPNWFYTATTKTVVPGKAGKEEKTREIDESFFNTIKGMATKGMYKLRCTFPIPGTANTWPANTNNYNDALCWQIDVFPPVGDTADSDSNAPGKFFGWVKVDLESPTQLTNIPEFPLDFERAITAQYGARTEEDEAMVSSWYQSAFIYTHEKDQQRVEALAAAAEAAKPQQPQEPADPAAADSPPPVDSAGEETTPATTEEPEKGEEEKEQESASKAPTSEEGPVDGTGGTTE